MGRSMLVPLSSGVAGGGECREMNQSWLQLQSPCLSSPHLLSPAIASARPLTLPSASSLESAPTSTTSRGGGGGGGGGQLTARERRQLRNERRESRAAEAGNWREDVEERLLQKPKKRYASWMEELNLDNLALLGPQWWVIRVPRVTGQETAERLARALARTYPDVEFKVYVPAVRVRRKLKNGSYSVKSNHLFPGCVFLHCILNKELHDFIRECDGVGGFLGSKVGNTKRQINRPRPVAADEMEAIFQQAKEEQQISDRAYEEEQRADGIFSDAQRDTNSYSDYSSNAKLKKDTKPKRRSRKGLELIESRSSEEDYKYPIPGSSVRVLSGPFTDYTGRLKELDQKLGKVTVGFMLFGKESFVDLDISQIVEAT